MAGSAPVHLADVQDHNGIGFTLAFSPDGRTLATAGNLGTLSLWTVKAHGEPTMLGRADGDDEHERLVAAALTSDGRRLTAVHSDGTAIVWDFAKLAGPVERATVQVHGKYLDSAAVSPSGDLIAALGWSMDPTVTLTDLSDPSAPIPLGALPDGPYGRAVAFGPDGRTLAVGKGSAVALWDLTDRRSPARLANLPGNHLVSAIAFSPDGRTVAVAADRTVNVWKLVDQSDPVLLGTLRGHFDSVLAVAFSPDGRTLATGSADKTGALWNVADPTRPRRLAILTGNGSPVWSVAFAPDGRTLATGTDNNAAALWDLAELSGPVRVATLGGAALKSKSLLFHPDGRTLTTSGTNRSSASAVLWDYSQLNDLRAHPADLACALTGGGLTPDDWASYIPEAPYQPTCPP
jgi:WD40 repeat protein